ncbi:MAG: two-component system histidine kinase PnpS [Candidatus Omnitrophota bacterium]
MGIGLNWNKKRLQELEGALKSASDNIASLQKQVATISGIFNSMVEGVVAVDTATRIISINPAIEKIFGIKEEEAKDKLFLEVIRNNDIAEVIDLCLSNKEIIQKELGLSWPVQKTFQINASPILEGEAVSGCLAVIHDITEIRRLETIRRDFVANISHELKTPITSIKGFVETLLSGGLEDNKNCRDFLRIIDEHTDRLNSLINDLLALSYLESKEVGLEKEKVNLKELADKVLTGFQSQLKKKGIEVTNGIKAEIYLYLDKDKIHQVFTNLLDNAIKFNKEKGFINIYSEDLNEKIKVAIEDSGSGIPAKDISRIFERFYRVDKARSRELGGTGLGLSIVKHIIELHAGLVGVESTEGLGSKFFFYLPKII